MVTENMKKSSIDNAREHSTNKIYVQLRASTNQIVLQRPTGEWGNSNEMFVEFFCISMCMLRFPCCMC